jgi:ppGpp synthetase/RelA/SpoT-type nucleotidyltranferase
MLRFEDRLLDHLRDRGLGTVTVERRVKSAAAVAAKRKRVPHGRINDFVGLRVIVDHAGDLAKAHGAAVLAGTELGLRVEKVEDRFEKPGHGGYRAVHIDFEFNAPPHAEIGVEVQITTAAIAAVSRVSHEVLYSRHGAGVQEWTNELEALFEEASQLDAHLATVSRRATERLGRHV